MSVEMSDEYLDIALPHRFKYRKYQERMETAIVELGRYVGLWHRRAGKDKTALNVMISEMVQHVGNYYYFFPTYKQGKKVIWDGKDRDGMKFLDHFPKELILSTNQTEMQIKFKPTREGDSEGSLFQVIGTDDYNSIMGTNPRGCVFSEYSLQDPRAWDYVRPILKENKGWAIFIYTPRGPNHGKTLYDMAMKNPKWFAEKLTIETTGTLTEEDMQEEREAGMSEDLIQQEYYCSFEGSIDGSYYAKQIRQARKDGRIRDVPYTPGIPVDTYWDLGMDGSTTIWFVQSVTGIEVRVIDYLENQGEGLAFYAKELKEKPYVYGTHYMPHDAKVRELGTGKSRKQTAEELGIRPINVVTRARDAEAVEAGIESCRNLLSYCYFDETKCGERGLAALENYRREYDEDNKVFKRKPLADWSAHGADGFRTLGVGWKPPIKKKKKSKPKFWLTR